jgi:tRNA A37 threonylcarbamoyladenosine biosynthesis protein TsaE
MEELLSKKKPIFIEWPEKIKRFLPSDTVWVKLNINENHIRTIEIADEYRS